MNIFEAICASRRWSELLNDKLLISYSVDMNAIGDGGAEAVAAAAETMPHLASLKLVLISPLTVQAQ